MALDDDIAMLAGVPVLSHFDRDALRLLAFAAEIRILRTGDILFREGDPAESGYVVTTGLIVLDMASSPPARVTAQPGDLIGELALFTPTTRTSTGTAYETSSVLKLSRDVMRRILIEFPIAAERIRMYLGERLKTLNADLTVVQTKLDRIKAPHG